MRSVLLLPCLAGCIFLDRSEVDAYGDLDGDGFRGSIAGGTDCDDDDPGVYPGQQLDLTPQPVWRDRDGDGAGELGEPVRAACWPAGDEAAAGGDCDDTDPDVFPGRQPAVRTLYTDLDQDGFGTTAIEETCRSAREGESETAGDCDDDDPAVGRALDQYADLDLDGFGSGSPVPSSTCVGLDAGFVAVGGDCNDADDAVGDVYPPQWRDADGDGAGDGAAERVEPVCSVAGGYVENTDDCDDGNPEVQRLPWYPDTDGDGLGDLYGAPALQCDSPGDDWSPLVGDCDDGAFGVLGNAEQWLDEDGDGYGGPVRSFAVGGCEPDAGYVANSEDCDDTDAALSPETVWFVDADLDGYGDAGQSSRVQCSSLGSDGAPLTRVLGDCNDADASVSNVDWLDLDRDSYGSMVAGPRAFPNCYGVPAVGRGDDCDDTTGLLHPDTVWIADVDGDGFGDPAVVVDTQCEPVPDAVADAQSGAYDCDDDDPDRNPTTEWWPDVDEDGLGSRDPLLVEVQCAGPDGATRVSGDCDDDNPKFLDLSWVDADGDGFGFGGPVLDCTGTAFEGNDCDDLDPGINPYTTWGRDADDDGYGVGPGTVQCQAPGTEYLPLPADPAAWDCDDTSDQVNPGKPDAFQNGADENCDGTDLVVNAPPGTTDHLPDLEAMFSGCAVVEPYWGGPQGPETLQQAIDDVAAEVLDPCTLIELLPSPDVDYPEISINVPGTVMLWAPDGGARFRATVGDAAITLTRRAGNVVLEGIQVASDSAVAVLTQSAGELVLSDVEVSEGGGIAEDAGTEPWAQAGPLRILGSRFSRSAFVVASNAEVEGRRGAYRTEEATLIGVEVTGALTEAALIDLESGATNVRGLRIRRSAALRSLVRIAGASADLEDVEVLESIGQTALSVTTADNRISGLRVLDNAFSLDSNSKEGVVSILGGAPFVEDVQVRRNLLEAVESRAMTWLLVRLDAGIADLHDVYVAQNDTGDDTVGLAITGVGSVLGSDVAVQVQDGTWLRTAVPVTLDHATFAGHSSSTAGLPRLDLAALLHLDASILEWDPGQPDLLRTGGPLLLELDGSVVDPDLAAICGGSCLVTGAVSGPPLLLRSWDGMSNFDADLRLSSASPARQTAPLRDLGALGPQRFTPATPQDEDPKAPVSYADFDGDGLYDDWEWQFFGSTAEDAAGDADLDLLTNLEEQERGSFPDDSDSDDDGCLDGGAEFDPAPFDPTCIP